MKNTIDTNGKDRAAQALLKYITLTYRGKHIRAFYYSVLYRLYIRLIHGGSIYGKTNSKSTKRKI